MLNIFSVIIIIFTMECTLIYGAEFVHKPQNLTIFNLKDPFFFNCSTDVASNEGMDWLIRIGERRERICSSRDFLVAGSNSCQLNYSMEVPNNRTLNLIVDPRIALLGDEYCCQFDNGAGKKSCSYLTLSHTASRPTNDPESADITKVIPHKNIKGTHFVTKPENRTFLKGQSLHFNCSTNSVPDSGIQWIFTSFLRPLSERHVVQWQEGLSVVQQGFTVERLDNLTSNLIVLNANSYSAGKYCCQFRNGKGGNLCAFAKEINLPKNEVVLPGSNVLLNCAQVRAFRWYRYLPSDLNDDKVIYMGSKMAYDADERFRVLTEPDANPYDRLDLYISNVQTDLFGTYKCQQPHAAHCAEIIVLESEPVCDVHLVKTLGLIAETAELSCRIKITANAEPEMLCSQNTTEYQRQSVCSMRTPDGVVTCTAEVPIDKLPDITCAVKFNPKPLQKYMTCIHVQNQPSYTYKWTPSYDELLQLNSTRMVLITCLIIATVSLITLSMLVLVITFCGRCVRKYFFIRSTSSSSCSTESDSLSTDSLEKSKIRDEYNVCIVNQHQLQKEVENGKLIPYPIDIPD